MSLRDLSDPKAVRMAVQLFDEMGRKAFLETYGFGKAHTYYLYENGRYYDSKAIVGVAHGIEFPGIGPMKAEQFTAGEKTVQKKLESLGFRIRLNSETPIILTENEATFGGHYDHWQDVTGERYQFPNQYKNLVVTDRPFIYYRGVRRQGGKRGPAEYFGHGLIGEVWRDQDIPIARPRKKWKWFCKIEDYHPFPKPVPFADESGYLEQIPQNQYRVGVRETSYDIYQHIVSRAGLRPYTFEEDMPAPDMPDLDFLIIQLVGGKESLLVKRPPAFKKEKGEHTDANYSRRTKHSKVIGDHSEQIVLRHLRETLSTKERARLRLVAEKKWGWDIEYIDKKGKRVAVEVKGTKGPRFPTVEVTAKEWNAAKADRSQYWLYLVAECMSNSPKIEKFQDPFALNQAGSWEATPLLWKLEF